MHTMEERGSSGGGRRLKVGCREVRRRRGACPVAPLAVRAPLAICA